MKKYFDPLSINHALTTLRSLRRKLLTVGFNVDLVRAEVTDPLASLQEQMAAASRAATTIQAAADAEGRVFTDDEEREFRSARDTMARIARQMELRNDMSELTAQMTAPVGRRTSPTAAPTGTSQDDRRPRASGMTVVASRDPRGGFNHFGEFLASVRIGSGPHGSMDDRLRAALGPDYGNEGAGADGGFAVPPDFRNAIWQKVNGEMSLLARCDQVITASNSMTFPKDELAPWDDSAGIKSTWTGEAGAKAQSKPQLDQATVRLNKLTTLVPMTDELLEDVAAMNSYVTRKAGEKIDFKVSMALYQGNGTGQPQGVLASPALVTAAAVAAQAADTILFPNIAAMYARLWAPSRQNAIWLVHPQVEEQLSLMAFQRTATEPTSPVPVYLPANSVAGSPFATLYGRPVVPSQVCNALGDVGDIALVDFNQFLALVKGGGVKQDISIHVYFENYVTAFRFVLRIGGQTWWGSPVTARAGTFTQSPYVVLAAR